MYDLFYLLLSTQEFRMVKMPEIKQIAAEKGIKAGKMKKVELVRAIQAAEGNYDCFATDRIEDCPEAGCYWREDCEKEFKA
jgi:hypothetical protein